MWAGFLRGFTHLRAEVQRNWMEEGNVVVIRNAAASIYYITYTSRASLTHYSQEFYHLLLSNTAATY